MRRALRILGWTFGILLAVILVSIAGCVVHANYRIAHDETQPYDAQAPGRYFTVQGHRLHVQTLGDWGTSGAGKPPLMLVHGFLLSGHTGFLPWARESLAPHRALILPDMLGYGFSERIPTPGDYYTLQSYARDLAGLLDRLGVRQVDVAGHSWGGVIAAQFARDFPQRVRRLVIIDGGFFFGKPSPLESITHLPLGIGRAVRWHALAGGPGSYVYRICRAAGSCEGEAVVHIEDSTDTLGAMMYTSRHSTGIGEIEASLGKIGASTLVLWGANDQLLPLSTAERLTHELPHARLAIIEDAWHMPWLEEPAATAQQLVKFLDEP